MQIANPAGRDAEKDIAGRVDGVSDIERCRWRRCVLQCQWNLLSVEAAFSGGVLTGCGRVVNLSRDIPYLMARSIVLVFSFFRRPRVMVADLAAPQPREIAFGGIRVDVVFAAQAVRLLMVDPVQLVAGMKLIP